MPAIRPLRILTAILPLATAACRHSGEPPADLVVRHGAVYTMDAARSWAGAVAVRGGRIVYVGADTLPPGILGPRTEVVDLKGGMLLPAFQDAHVHLIDGGVELGDCDLTDAESAAQVAAAVRSYAAAHPTLPWIRGSGWQLPYFPDGNPRKELLDSLVSDRPAFLWAADGHSAWANSRALLLAGITRQVVLEICREEYLPTEETTLHDEELLEADEVFLTSSTREIVPVVRVDHTTIADGIPGAITQTLIAAFRAKVEQLCPAPAEQR